MAIITKGVKVEVSKKEVDSPASVETDNNILQFRTLGKVAPNTPGAALKTVLQNQALKELIFNPATIDNVNQSKGQLRLDFPVNDKFICNTLVGNTENSKNKENLIKLEFHGSNIANRSYMKISGEVYKQDIQDLAEWFSEQESYLQDSGILKSLIMINNLYVRDLTLGLDGKDKTLKQMNYIARQLVDSLAGFEKLEDIWIEILDAYFEDHRVYHNIEHIYDSLLKLYDYQNDYETAHLSLAESDSKLVKLAIIFHDFVYEVGSTDNEEKSAEKTEDLLKSINFSERNIEIIKHLILATKPLVNKDSDATNMVKLISDIDLAGFGLPWAKFLVQNKKIAKEFMPDGPAISGIEKQINFLEKLQGKIYQTEYFIELYEHIAQANIKKEIMRLKHQIQGILEDEQKKEDGGISKAN